mgnify:CR=1 FL=1
MDQTGPEGPPGPAGPPGPVGILGPSVLIQSDQLKSYQVEITYTCEIGGVGCSNNCQTVTDHQELLVEVVLSTSTILQTSGLPQ